MKKSRIAKLALMGASVTALAATLTTSTYAWYVSNKTANVNAVAGSTAAGTSDNTIAVSLTGARNDFHKTISLANPSGTLSPLLRQNKTLTATGAIGAAYYGIDESGDTVVLNDTAESTGWYTYTFYMLASVNCSVSAVLTATNTTSSFATLTQVNYSNPGTGANGNKITGVDSGASFTLDALQACRMSLAIETGAFASTAADAAYGKADTTTVPTEYTGLVSAVTTAGTMVATDYGTVHPSAGAHNYYEFMTSKTLASATKAAYAPEGVTAAGFTNFSLTAGTPVKLVYSLWLDGASDLCFNACQGQSISVAFDYTATPSA